jgi:hypothetical protein
MMQIGNAYSIFSNTIALLASKKLWFKLNNMFQNQILPQNKIIMATHLLFP